MSSDDEEVDVSSLTLGGAEAPHLAPSSSGRRGPPAKVHMPGGGLSTADTLSGLTQNDYNWHWGEKRFSDALSFCLSLIRSEYFFSPDRTSA